MKTEMACIIGSAISHAILICGISYFAGTSGALRHDLWLRTDDLQKAKREISILEDSLRLSELKAAQAAENYMRLAEESKKITEKDQPQ